MWQGRAPNTIHAESRITNPESRMTTMAIQEYDAVIVGAGPAGMTAALYAARALLSTVVLERGEPGGELLNTEYLENFISYPKVLGRDLAAKFASHAREAGAEIREFTSVDHVAKREDGMFETVCDNGDIYIS